MALSGGNNLPSIFISSNFSKTKFDYRTAIASTINCYYLISYSLEEDDASNQKTVSQQSLVNILYETILSINNAIKTNTSLITEDVLLFHNPLQRTVFTERGQ